MRTFPKHNLFRLSLVRILAVAAMVMIALANGLDGRGARAAMRLPEEVASLEPWMLPPDVIPAVVETAQRPEVLPAPNPPRRTAAAGPSKAAPDRARRLTGSRAENRALVEFMGLVWASGEEQSFMRSFERFQSCRKFVAINC